MAAARPLVLLAWILLGAAAAAQPGRADGGPVPDQVVARDTFYNFGVDPDDLWTTRFFGVEDHRDLWIEIRDPYGGEVLIPSTLHVSVGSRARAARQETDDIVTITATVVELAVGSGLALVGLLALVVGPIAGLRRRLRRAREQGEAFQETALRLAESREEERKRLARELHDGPLQELHALHMQLGVAADALTAALGDGHAVELRRLRGAQDEAHTVIGELRGIAEALRPPALGPFGLAAALRAHAERFGRQHPGVAVTLELDDDGQALPEPVRLALFRIAQEAMTNAAKHAAPSRVSVSLRLTAAAVTLAVEDDGAGFSGDPADPALAAGGHFGLLGMRERAGALGADLRVGRGGAGGVRVEVVAPR